MSHADQLTQPFQFLCLVLLGLAVSEPVTERPVDHNCPPDVASNSFNWTCDLSGTWHPVVPPAPGLPFGPPAPDYCWSIIMSKHTAVGVPRVEGSVDYHVEIKFNQEGSCVDPGVSPEFPRSFNITVPKVDCVDKTPCTSGFSVKCALAHQSGRSCFSDVPTGCGCNPGTGILDTCCQLESDGTCQTQPPSCATQIFNHTNNTQKYIGAAALDCSRMTIDGLLVPPKRPQIASCTRLHCELSEPVGGKGKGGKGPSAGVGGSGQLGDPGPPGPGPHPLPTQTHLGRSNSVHDRSCSIGSNDASDNSSRSAVVWVAGLMGALVVLLIIGIIVWKYRRAKKYQQLVSEEPGDHGEGPPRDSDYKLLGDNSRVEDPLAQQPWSVTTVQPATRDWSSQLCMLDLPQKIKALRHRTIHTAELASKRLPSTEPEGFNMVQLVVHQSFEMKWLWLGRRQQLQGTGGRQVVQFKMPEKGSIKATVLMMLDPRNQEAWINNQLIFTKQGDPPHQTIAEARAFTRSVFTGMLKHLVAPESRLFRSSGAHDRCYVLKPHSVFKDKHQALYSLVGQVLAKVVVDKHAVAVHFGRDVYQALLIGRTQPAVVGESLAAMAAGFDSVIQPELSQVFDTQELEMLTCGLTSLHPKELQQRTRYEGGLEEDDQLVMWLWDTICGFDMEARTRLLQFCFGCSIPPPLEDDACLLTVVESKQEFPTADPSRRIFRVPRYGSQAEMSYHLRVAIDLDVDIRGPTSPAIGSSSRPPKSLRAPQTTRVPQSTRAAPNSSKPQQAPKTSKPPKRKKVDPRLISSE